MHTETLAPNTKSILDNLSLNHSVLDNFYLSGGTALALHLGHRESEDLDFFTQNEFDPQLLQTKLEKITTLTDVSLESGTLNCYSEGVKLQFLHYPYGLLETPIIFQNMKLSSVIDIACTKLITISARGSKKDFLDLFFILQEYSLTELFGLLPKKYTQTDYNLLHLLKSLVFFEDAENQPNPKMHKQISWEVAKKHIANTVKNFEI
ncbi:hypothetical protein A2572_02710 [Candidatus Collierbacteria bacterium RIFOXYD1_FULL_40_9]|uniref:Nucleotidyl transferase AbiEii/AbiGii toxin family protein n=1 Tax=Candidatus Collierbacteria bacterium RIFOXYD1_FULL_40_9 TaxID=1817731 RepID=A0A1F5FW95_9BACT|nr:MAG: hypothetical protein A2572_02710 [Candidatus Collierbacteria bacterium RIFOXYD1_FULL_40_9]